MRTVAGLAKAIDDSKIGKRMPYCLYVHRSAWGELDSSLRSHLGVALLEMSMAWRRKGLEPNVVKFDTKAKRIVFACYESFDTHEHPRLLHTFSIEILTRKQTSKDYRLDADAPILHRKELFVTQDHPDARKWSALTKAEEKAGLYQEPSRIGRRLAWEALLRFKGLVIHDHTLERVSHGQG